MISQFTAFENLRKEIATTLKGFLSFYQRTQFSSTFSSFIIYNLQQNAELEFDFISKFYALKISLPNFWNDASLANCYEQQCSLSIFQDFASLADVQYGGFAPVHMHTWRF